MHSSSRSGRSGLDKNRSPVSSFKPLHSLLLPFFKRVRALRESTQLLDTPPGLSQPCVCLKSIEKKRKFENHVSTCLADQQRPKRPQEPQNHRRQLRRQRLGRDQESGQRLWQVWPGRRARIQAPKGQLSLDSSIFFPFLALPSSNTCFQLQICLHLSCPRRERETENDHKKESVLICCFEIHSFQPIVTSTVMPLSLSVCLPVQGLQQKHTNVMQMPLFLLGMVWS